MATKKQKQRIHMLKSALGLNRDEYESWMSSFGAASTKDLAAWQAAEFENALKEHAIMLGKWNAAPEKTDPELATYKQRVMIRGMWNEVSYLPEDKREAGLQDFLMKRYNSTIDYIEKNKVFKVVAALKTMRRNKK